MEGIYDNLLIVVLFPIIILWLFMWLYKNYSASGFLFTLRQKLAFGWLSMKQIKAIKALYSSTNTIDKLIDGVLDSKYDSNIISYYGTDQNQNFLFIKINRRQNASDELVLLLKLQDGRFFELPDHPNTVINDVGKSTWSAAGLKISVLQSSRRTRILFNGLLREGNQMDINCDDDVQHVRFNCIFIASTKPYSKTEYWSPNLLSKSLAQYSWKMSKWEQILNDLNINQVDQYGSMMAEVTFEDSSKKLLYLDAIRQSQWGNFGASCFRRNIYITATDTLGFSFYLRSSNLKNGVKNMQFGHMKIPNDNVHPITSMDLDTDQLFDFYNNGSDEFAFQFTAGERTFNVLIKLHRETLKTLYGGFKWDTQYIYCQFELKLNDTNGIGMIQICQPYSGYCPMNISALNTFIKPNKSLDKHVYTLLFDDEKCQSENLVGGKGASLAELTALKYTEFTVPQGFCVTTNALNVHINSHPKLTKIIDEFVKVCSKENVEDIQEYSQKVVNEFKSFPMFRLVKTMISAELRTPEFKNKNYTYAIRSSAVGEDSEDTSAAGQNSTFLGVKSLDDIVTSVIDCWASVYTYQSVEYRRQHGLPIKASMGVCVQQMVNAEAAGVMFTRHPITGNPKEIFISSNYGLGESVVSGLTDPDTIIIQRDQKSSLSIKSSSIGKKLQKIIVGSNEGGTIQSEVSENEKSKLSISEEIALKLAEVGVKLDRLYNAARDIEWAVVEGQIYLLQCRPVTALDTWTDFELTHELGSGVPNGSDILTRANVGEVAAKTWTPLTISTVAHAANVSMESSVVRCLLDSTYKRHMFIANWKCFLNYTSIFLRYPEEKLNLVQKITDIAMCGHTLVTPEINEISLKRNGGPINKQIKCKIMRAIASDFWNNSGKVKQAKQIVEQCKSTWKETQNVSSKQLHNWLSEMILEHIKLASIHSHTTRCSILSQVLVTSILAEGSEELSTDHYSDIALLLASCKDVVSAQVPIALNEITQTIKQNGLSEDFKNVDPSKVLFWLLKNCPKAYEQIQKFMEIHGHRGIEELELITETWSMKPEKFLSTIQSMLNSTTDNSPKTVELTPQETVALLKTPLKSSTRWIISKLLPWMRRTVSQREQTKSLVTESVHKMRLGYRKLSEILVQEGRLPEQELVFFLTHEELAEVINGPCPTLIRKAVRRRKLKSKLDVYEYNEVNHGMPKPIEVTSQPRSTGEVCIKGTSVCNGVVTGRAFVALSLEEAPAIQQGDILMTHATDIGWSPYFPLLAGVVTELGGLISHGAVVAREYGLPCIVGAENVTRNFKTGDIVMLNGCVGTLGKIEMN